MFALKSSVLTALFLALTHPAVAADQYPADQSVLPTGTMVVFEHIHQDGVQNYDYVTTFLGKQDDGTFLWDEQKIAKDGTVPPGVWRSVYRDQQGRMVRVDEFVVEGRSPSTVRFDANACLRVVGQCRSVHHTGPEDDPVERVFTFTGVRFGDTLILRMDGTHQGKSTRRKITHKFDCFGITEKAVWFRRDEPLRTVTRKSIHFPGGIAPSCP